MVYINIISFLISTINNINKDNKQTTTNLAIQLLCQQSQHCLTPHNFTFDYSSGLGALIYSAILCIVPGTV